MVVQVSSRWQEVQRDRNKNALVINYVNLRRVIGYIGFLLPAVLFVGAWSISRKSGFSWQWPASLSGYYFTSMRNFLVGALCAIAVFLIAYCGYNELDRWITNLAGIFALGVAFFPTSNPNFHPLWISYFHQAFSILMMTFLSLMALQFTRTKSSTEEDLRDQLGYLWHAFLGEVPPTAQQETEAQKRLAELEAVAPAESQVRQKIDLQKIARKRQRNRIYTYCAWLILVWIALSLLQNLFYEPAWHLFFFCEVFALWTFAVSWFVKGETLLKDPPEPTGNQPGQANLARARSWTGTRGAGTSAAGPGG
jgi:hypothetical protein